METHSRSLLLCDCVSFSVYLISVYRCLLHFVSYYWSPSLRLLSSVLSFFSPLNSVCVTVFIFFLHSTLPTRCLLFPSIVFHCLYFLPSFHPSFTLSFVSLYRVSLSLFSSFIPPFLHALFCSPLSSHNSPGFSIFLPYAVCTFLTLPYRPIFLSSFLFSALLYS
jgi:hypothetical protein